MMAVYRAKIAQSSNVMWVKRTSVLGKCIALGEIESKVR